MNIETRQVPAAKRKKPKSPTQKGSVSPSVAALRTKLESRGRPSLKVFGKGTSLPSRSKR